METHIQDIVNLLHYQNLSDVQLVGHSLGGFAITGVADRASERLASLIYLDAYVPKNGESFFDLVDNERRRAIEQTVRRDGDGWRFPPPQIPSESSANSHPSEDLWNRVRSRLVPQPFQTLTQPLRLLHSPDQRLARSYIVCTRGVEDEPLEPRLERIRTDPAWRWREIDAEHLVHITDPDLLTDTLLALV